MQALRPWVAAGGKSRGPLESRRYGAFVAEVARIVHREVRAQRQHCGVR